MKKIFFFLAALTLALLCTGCGSGEDTSSVDTKTGATAMLLPLGGDVCVRAGTDPDGALLLDTDTMEGFFASDSYTDEMPYGFALVLTNEGKKEFRNATRDLAKTQTPVTLWAGDEAICSPVITTMLNTKYVILNIASVTDKDSYDHVVAALSSD